MEEDFLVTSLGIFPGESQRSALQEGAGGVAVEDYFLVIPILIFLANHVPVLLNFLGSHASTSPQGLLFEAVIVKEVIACSVALSLSNYHSQSLSPWPKCGDLGLVFEAAGAVQF